MLAEERQNQILHMLRYNDAVTTADLTRTLRVSIETVRRDLVEMEEKNLLRRVHGGAVRVSDMTSFSHLEQRNHVNVALKKELSEYAMPFISEHDFIGIDEGSTAIYFAETVLRQFSSLTVVTHSMDVFEILRAQKNFTVILCGGHYQPEEHAFYGALTMEMYARLHLQKSFIFPSAISYDFGIADHQQNMYLVQKAMIQSSDSIFVLADSTKFEKKALIKVDDMRTDYCYITDSHLNRAYTDLYSEHQIHIIKGKSS